MPSCRFNDSILLDSWSNSCIVLELISACTETSSKVLKYCSIFREMFGSLSTCAFAVGLLRRPPAFSSSTFMFELLSSSCYIDLLGWIFAGGEFSGFLFLEEFCAALFDFAFEENFAVRLTGLATLLFSTVNWSSGFIFTWRKPVLMFSLCFWVCDKFLKLFSSWSISTTDMFLLLSAWLCLPFLMRALCYSYAQARRS